ncbi:MAG: hypothetical protein LQ337_005749 [Flavoplaca oasis]|nr:MAG: hypothetical protein LQ337_005749 [Flavoplaca oasis]
MPSKAKRKTAGVIKNKRKNNQRLATKKARKLVKKKGYTQQRKELQEYLDAEIEMKDVDMKSAAKQIQAVDGKADVDMEID